MIALLIVPLLTPLCAPLLARRLSALSDPGRALWALVIAAVLLAGCSTAALGGILLAGALRMPFVARLEDLIHPLHAGPPLVLLTGAVLAAGLLATGSSAVGRFVLRRSRVLRAARAEADAGPTIGGVSVVDDDRVEAYALPGSPGRVVVTRGMLRSLSAPERAALLAHERAHLSGRHHLFLAAAELAAHCHPALRPLRAEISLAVERVADEVAARAVGDRRLTARAIGRAALAAHASGTRTAFLPSATAGPVPRRVAALLHRPLAPRGPVAVFGLLLLLCAGLSSVTTLAGAVSLHSSVEVAQGEAPAPH